MDLDAKTFQVRGTVISIPLARWFPKSIDFRKSIGHPRRDLDVWALLRFCARISGLQKTEEQDGSTARHRDALHKATKRDYLARMVDDKVHCMMKAKEYEFDYWDGDRRYGYGGYKFIEGRWKPVAQALIDIYGLKNGSKVLDVGCGKAFLLYEMKKILPDLQVAGFDISQPRPRRGPRRDQAAICSATARRTAIRTATSISIS